MDQKDTTASTAGCLVLPADRGPGADARGTRRIAGQHFDIELVRFGPGERVVRIGELATGEEVAAVLQGTLQVESCGESYSLSAGEGIIIPPGQGSSWHCAADGGLLYRVINRAPTRSALSTGAAQTR